MNTSNSFNAINAIKSISTLPDNFQAMLETIIRTTQPHSIWVFGSHAKGTAHADSDLDIMVILPHVQHAVYDAARIRAALFDAPCALDILVSTPQDMEWKSQHWGTMEHEVLQHGTEVYHEAA